MADEDDGNIVPIRAVTSSPTNQEKVTEAVRGLLKLAEDGHIDFVCVVAVPSDGSHPEIFAAGEADPYRVIGALLKGARDLTP